MAPIEEPFKQAATDWDLERLYRDLARVKQQSGKRYQLTAVEMACLRGLLCRHSPNEIASVLNRELRGLRVDLSRGLYRYVETLTGRTLNTLKDWRDVADWLLLAGYQTLSDRPVTQTKDSPIKIVDVAIGGSKISPILDIKVRNIGSQVAFLKKTKFHFYNAWFLQGWVFNQVLLASPPAPCAAPGDRSRMSRAVEPSYDYQVAIDEEAIVKGTLEDLAQRGVVFTSNAYQAEFSQLNPLYPTNNTIYSEEFNISQCVGCNDVDRFTFTISFPKAQSQEYSNTCQLGIYHFNLEIVYDEDDKTVQSQPVILLVESKEVPTGDRYFFEEDCPPHFINQIIPKFKEYSQLNKEVLAEVTKIEGIRSAALNKLIQTQQNRKPTRPSLWEQTFGRLSGK
ncbi:MAG TPA: hypothetical protein DDZ80_09605 [Cyanobacteria bacterium UBA8803]|nr:hypothetical protein [Cyanobacteria bacterium UBA9273]HBL58751.1 hypothetical protein [Cyanobacteria bacterium UBA8803]